MYSIQIKKWHALDERLEHGVRKLVVWRRTHKREGWLHACAYASAFLANPRITLTLRSSALLICSTWSEDRWRYLPSAFR